MYLRYYLTRPGYVVDSLEYIRLDLDPNANKIFPVPGHYAGLLIFSEHAVNFVSHSGDPAQYIIDQTIITAVAEVDTDGSRFLIGDHKGQLSMLILDRDDRDVCR